MLRFASIPGFCFCASWLTYVASSFGFSSSICVEIMDSVFVVGISSMSTTRVISSSGLLVLWVLHANWLGPLNFVNAIFLILEKLVANLSWVLHKFSLTRTMFSMSLFSQKSQVFLHSPHFSLFIDSFINALRALYFLFTSFSLFSSFPVPSHGVSFSSTRSPKFCCIHLLFSMHSHFQLSFSHLFLLLLIFHFFFIFRLFSFFFLFFYFFFYFSSYYIQYVQIYFLHCNY
jgi:hypothetical protein